VRVVQTFPFPRTERNLLPVRTIDSGKAKAGMPASVDAFLDQCRALQNAAARLCQDDSGLSTEARDSVKKLRTLLLETRRRLLPAPPAAPGAPVAPGSPPAKPGPGFKP
jgi:hypothetical protein